MKRIVIFVSAIAMFVACNSGKGFIVEGTVANADDGEIVCLTYPVERDGIWYQQRDTAYVDGGRFRFEGEVDGVVSAEISFQNMDFAQLFLAQSDIKFSADRSKLYDYSLSGLSVDDDLLGYRRAFAEYDKAVYEKNHEAMCKNEEWVAATAAGLASANDLWNEFYAIVMEHHAISATWSELAIKFVKSHPNNALVPHIIDELIKRGCDEQTVDSLINALSEEQRNSTLGQLMAIRSEISQPNCGHVGSKASNFTLNSIDGSCVTLSESYAKGYVLLDFWASWCRPCIDEIPKVRELHREYGDRLQLLSISVDSDISQWRDAVTQHRLTEWPQLIIDDLENTKNYYFAEQTDLSRAYDIEQIPCFILVDNNGVIVGRWSHITPTTISEIERIIGSVK